MIYILAHTYTHGHCCAEYWHDVFFVDYDTRRLTLFNFSFFKEKKTRNTTHGNEENNSLNTTIKSWTVKRNLNLPKINIYTEKNMFKFNHLHFTRRNAKRKKRVIKLKI